MLFGVSSYSFSRLVKNGTMKQIDVIAKAKEMGFDVIEFSTISVPEGKTLPEFAKELKAEADRVGIPIKNYTIGANFLAADLDKEIERLKKEVDIAEILGAPGMRHDVSTGIFPEDWKGARTYDNALPRIVRGCREITEYAAAKGIRTMTENHGFFSQDYTRVEKLVSMVDHPNFGLLLDMGNFTCADNNPAEAIGRLVSLAFHCHAKDFHIKSGMEPSPGKGWFCSRSGNWLRGAIIGHGNVPVFQCIRTLVRNKYNGVLSIEFEGMEDVLQGISIGLENLRRFVALAEEQDGEKPQPEAKPETKKKAVKKSSAAPRKTAAKNTKSSKK